MSELSKVVLEFVRGDRNLDDLRAVGITIVENDDGFELLTPGGEFTIADVKDVATGFLKLLHDPVALTQWSSILLAASGVLDLSLEEDPYGQAILEGLWDASNAGKVRESAVLAARELVVC